MFHFFKGIVILLYFLQKFYEMYGFYYCFPMFYNYLFKKKKILLQIFSNQNKNTNNFLKIQKNTFIEIDGKIENKISIIVAITF